MISGSFIADKCPMNESRQSASRSSTVDSGLGSATASERSSTLDSRLSSRTASTLSRDTPTTELGSTTTKEVRVNRPVHIPRTPVMAGRCYQQAFVSHVDHPSAFFLQLPISEKQYKELEQEINDFYSENPMPNPSGKWDRGEYCIAKFKDGRFYRSRIVAIPEMIKKDNTYDVVFLDYGNWDRVAFTDIHILQRKFANQPAQAIPCSLTRSLPVSYGDTVAVNGESSGSNSSVTKNSSYTQKQSRSMDTWFDHPLAVKFFKDLVLDQYVNATFERPPSRNYWQLPYVDLKLSSTGQDIREDLLKEKLISTIPNEQIYQAFNHLMTPVDMIIYSIRHEDEDYDDDDDQC